MGFIKDFKDYSYYVYYATKTGLKAEVAESYLNWIWWVLEPLFFMVIYAWVFGVVFQTSEQYFPIFIFIGNAMWSFFSKTLGTSVTLIRRNETVISKVYMPKFVLLLVEMGINAFKMLLSFIIVAVMLIVCRVQITHYVFYAVPVLVVFFIVTFGFSAICMNYGVYIEDLSYIISILLNMLMFFTGVFYAVETRVPAPFGQILGTYNPVAFLISAMRKAVMYGECPSILILTGWLVASVLISILGIKILYKNENNYVKVI